MGYSTDFTGCVTVEPPLNPAEIAYLTKFADTRRMDRAAGPYFVAGGGYAGQDREADVRDYNRPPAGQPNVWCKWEPTEDGSEIKWNGVEKFNDADDWMTYLVDHFLREGATASTSGDPQFAEFTFNHVVNGVIEAQGEDADDRWDLIVSDNAVAVRKYAMVSAEATIVPPPNLGGTDWDWTDVEGNELTISGDGSLMVDAADDWVDLNANQWAQVAAVALLMSERLGTTKAEG